MWTLPFIIIRLFHDITVADNRAIVEVVDDTNLSTTFTALDSH